MIKFAIFPFIYAVLRHGFEASEFVFISAGFDFHKSYWLYQVRLWARALDLLICLFLGEDTHIIKSKWYCGSGFFDV